MKYINSPLVSIIMPTYNSELTLGAAISSVQNQTYENWELIITDDCSSDSTKQRIQEIAANDSRIVFFENLVNSGAAISRNNSLKAVKGDYIAFLDSDDIWDVNKLEYQLSWMKENEEIAFSFTAYQLVDESGISLNKFVDLQGENLSFTYRDMLFKQATLGCSTVMLKRNAFGEIQMPNIRTGQDYALWLQLLKQQKRAFLFNEVLTKYRISPGSISRNKFKKAKRQWQIYRHIEKLPFWYSVICFASYSWRAIKRR